MTPEAHSAHQAKRARECAALDNMEFVDIGIGTMRLPRGEHVDTLRPATGSAIRKDAGSSLIDRPVAGAPLYQLVTLYRDAGLPEPVPEHQFHPVRRWRFDYAWPLRLLALEVEGGQWVNGRHNRGSGQIADMEKYSAAALLGWRILYYTPQQMRDGTAMAALRIEFAGAA